MSITGTRQFTIANPSDLDGDPYEVADKAVRQAEALAKILVDTLEAAEKMVANAELERQLYFDDECDYGQYADSALASQMERLINSAKFVADTAGPLARAASYNPKKPPKE